MLTDTKLRNLKPKDKLYKVNDRDGLYVAVTPAGSISFRYNYSIHGRQETITFGRYGVGGIMGRGQQGRSGTHGSLPGGRPERSRRPGCRRPRMRTTMTNDQEPRVRELSPAEIEALRQEMRRSIKWAQAELERRRATKPLIGPSQS
jgi:hypothetical protein